MTTSTLGSAGSAVDTKVSGVSSDARFEDFGGLLFELYEEFGRALDAGELAWCAVLDGLLIPQVEAQVLL